MDTRARILEATAELLSTSADGDVSTRAVCEAAGVAAPALYRQFGDKDGLLAAVADHGFERYLAAKRALRDTDDPVADLHRGWATHTAFARAHPHFYRLMFAPRASAPSTGAAEAFGMLLALLERIAAAGRLATTPETAARMIMSANVGVSLSLVSRPDLYPDEEFGEHVRDAVFAAVLTDVTARPARSVAQAAVTLDATLRRQRPRQLTESETALLREWLDRIAH